jgi:hypothetical protein
VVGLTHGERAAMLVLPKSKRDWAAAVTAAVFRFWEAPCPVADTAAPPHGNGQTVAAVGHLVKLTISNDHVQGSKAAPKRIKQRGS